MTRGGRIDPICFPEGAFDSDDRIDVAIAESFPASDAPSWNGGLETTIEWQIAGILAATDWSDCSRNALDHAIELARMTGAALAVVHVREKAPDYDDLYRSGVQQPDLHPPHYSELYSDALEPSLAAAPDQEAAGALAQTHHDQLTGWAHVRQMTVTGPAVEMILDAAQQTGAGIIVVGSHGRPAFAGALLGSTADAVIRRSRLPVLAVPCEVPRNETGAVVAVLDEPQVASVVLARAVSIAAALQAELVTLRVPNDGRVGDRTELQNAAMAVIAFPRDESRKVNRSDPNVRMLLRSGLCPVLTIPVK